ncbi:hypothetical protein MKW92_044794, partial [Papaver armeniacum]
MEAANEEGSLLSSIIPPRLEDAGLEDCALSHDSIKEAFLKAANSLKSWAPTDPDSEDEDPREELGLPDSLIGVKPASDPPSSCCSNEKGNGLPEVIGDEVCVGGDGSEISEKESDRILGLNVPQGKIEDACIDGLQGLKIDDNNNEDDEEESESENPILFVVAVGRIRTPDLFFQVPTSSWSSRIKHCVPISALKVVQNEDLYQQIGRDVYYDLVDHDKVRSIWVRNSTPFNSFNCLVVFFFFFFFFSFPPVQTCGPYRPLAHEEEKPVGQLKRNKTIAAERILLSEALELG